MRALGDTTILSQSRDGAAPSTFEVKISQVSPESKVESSGTSLPLTLAPMHECPTSVCTEYAKSIGVAPRGSVTTRPFGVKTNTSS